MWIGIRVMEVRFIFISAYTHPHDGANNRLNDGSDPEDDSIKAATDGGDNGTLRRENP
jgi:hypothetical protein